MLSIVIEKENILDEKYIKIDDKKDINHIYNVYRLNIGDKIRAVDGEFEYILDITSISKKQVLTEIIEKKEDSYSLDVNIDIAMGIIKNDNMKLAIKKLTEIGVRKIIPLKTDRVVIKINEKKEKWEDVVIEAMKQCRAVKKTIINPIKKIRDLNIKEYDLVLFLYENASNSNKIIDKLKKEYKNILCIVGPEGGFTENEVLYMKKSNFIEIGLGKRILRAETASILIASVISQFLM